LVLALLAVGVVPLVAVNFSLQNVFAPALTQQTQNNHILVARSAAERLAATLGARRSLAESLARNRAVLQDPNSPAAQELIAGLLGARPEVAGIRLRTGQDAEILRVQRRDYAGEVQIALDQPWDPEAGTQLVQGDFSLWLRQDVPFLGSTDGGAVQLITEGGFLGELFRPEEIGDQAEMVLIDRDKQILAGSAPSLDAFPPEVVNRAVTGAVSGAEVVESEGVEPTLAAYFPVEGTPWVMVSAQPRRAAERQAAELRRHSLTALAASLLLTGLVVFFAYASLVRPLRSLLASQREALGWQADEGQEGSEIQQLQRNFELLQRRLRDQQSLGELFLGRYRVEGVLGEGGMGTVLRCHDTALDRPVAIKTFRLSDALAGSLQPEERRQRITKLRQEAVANARINHPNVTALYDVVDQGDVAFLVMEMVEGSSLDHLLDQCTSLPPEEVAHLALHVARGLAAAHEEGLVHHDLKPGNILLGKDGGIKLVDFGIAKFVSEVTESADTVFGTPGYLPPEAVRGGRYDQAGDYFALGVVLYYCLVGRLPFTGRTVRDILVSTLLDDPTPPSRYVPDLDPDLERAVLGLLEKKPEQRRAVGSGLVAVLEGIEDRRWNPGRLDFPEGGTHDESKSQMRSRLCPTVSVDGLDIDGSTPVIRPE
jgi:serine/threonine-protein kinase